MLLTSSYFQSFIKLLDNFFEITNFCLFNTALNLFIVIELEVLSIPSVLIFDVAIVFDFVVVHFEVFVVDH